MARNSTPKDNLVSQPFDRPKPDYIRAAILLGILSASLAGWIWFITWLATRG